MQRQGGIWRASELLEALLQPLAAMGEQIVSPAVGPAGGDALEEVGEIAAGIDASGVGRGDEREHVRDALGSRGRVREKPRPSANPLECKCRRI
jgi:hypothetical protein